MQSPRHAINAGSAVPENGETRTAPTVSGLMFNHENEQRDGSGLVRKGKPADSRTEVIVKAKRIGLQTHTTSPQKLAELMAVRDSMPGNSGLSQEARLLAALRHWPVTTYEAHQWLDMLDLRARVMSLRNQGHQIETVWVLAPTECGRTHRLGKYVLQQGNAHDVAEAK